MLARRRAPPSPGEPAPAPACDQAQTLRCLGWLARSMRKHNLTQFRLDGLQPTWLATRAEQRAMRRWAGLIAGLGVGAAAGLGVGLGVWLIAGPTGGLIVGPFVGLWTGLGGGLFTRSKEQIRPANALSWSWSWSTMSAALRSGLISGLIAGPTTGLIVGPIAGLGAGLAVGMGVGLAVGMAVGMGVGLAVGLPGSLPEGPEGMLATSASQQRASLSWMPDDGIRCSAKQACAGVSAGLLAGGLAGALAGTLAGTLTRELASALTIVLTRGLAGALTGAMTGGLILGLLLGLVHGGWACAQHLVLRIMLVRAGRMPRHCIRFLDYAVEQALLRRVGSAYEFIHPLLLEYFADIPIALSADEEYLQAHSP